MAEPLFDPSLKKKKKKKTVAFNEDPLAGDADPTVPLSPQSPGPTIHEQTKLNGIEREADALKAEAKKEEARKEEEDELALLDGFKKKKKKKAIPMDLETMEQSSAPAPSQSESTAEVPSVDDFDLSDLKKKKKSSKKKAADLEAFEKELGDKEEGANGHDLGGEEELGEDPFENEGEAAAEIVGVDTGKEPWIGSDRDYRYPELLDRFFSALHAANPALASNMGKRYTIAPPQILREGNKKSIFANIPDICRRMHRQPEHVIAFMLAEMGTTGSVDGSGRLVIKGRFLQKQVENVLRRYIVEYVTCKTCKSPDTILTKENRIYFMACESCGSRRSVSTIKSGFQAQIGRRSKNKTT